VIENSFCEDELVILESAGESLRWFIDEFRQELVSDSNVYDAGYLDADTHMYYLDQIIDGCVSELNPQEVVVHPLPIVDLGEDTIIYLGEEILITCDASGEYLWQDNSTQNSFRFVADDFGIGIHEIDVTVTNEASCLSSDQIMIEVRKPLGINPNDSDFVLVYPNPTSGLIIVEFKKNIELPISLNMYDTKGQCVHEQEIELMQKGDKIEINLSGEAKGLYMLLIRDQGSNSIYRIVYE
jgi:hypothetical protein